MAHNLVGRVPLVEAEYEKWEDEQVKQQIHKMLLAARLTRAAEQQSQVSFGGAFEAECQSRAEYNV